MKGPGALVDAEPLPLPDPPLLEPPGAPILDGDLPPAHAAKVRADALYREDGMFRLFGAEVLAPHHPDDVSLKNII